MNKRLIYVCIIVFIFLFNAATIQLIAEANVDFSQEELQFIEENSIIVTAVDPEFSPYEFIDSDGVYKGIAADYLKLIEINTGLTFNIKKKLTWPEAYELAQKGEIDLLPCLGITKQRQEYFFFSDVYLTYQRVLLSRVDSPTYNFKKLDDIVVGVQKNSSHNSYLAMETDIKPVLFDNNDELLLALSYGEIDSAITNYAASRYRIKKLGITNIKIDQIFDDNINEFGMAINHKKEILASIINKGLAQITEEEKIQIQNKWFGIEQAPDYSNILINALYGIGAILIIFLFFFYWNYTLKKEITHRKKVEDELIEAKKEAEHANSAKSIFLAHMSHEIRTPLNAINGIAYLLENTKTYTIQTKYINNLKNASYNLLNIINDILNFSKIEAGEVEVEHVVFSLDNLLNKVSSLLMPKAEEKNLSFHVKKDITIQDQLIGDPIRIEQILINFLNNAIKFTKHGEIELKVELIDSTFDSCKLKFSVKDTGIGISDEQMQNLFIPFHQLDSSINRKYGGTGLGLSISKNIIELLEGTISVKSMVNVGSVFSMILPFKIEESRIQKELTHRYQNLLGIKVLLVDEDKVAKGIVVDYLKTLKIDVDSTDSLKKAYYKIDILKQKYDLLIVEINMSGGSSLELVKHAKDLGIKTILTAKQIKESQYESAESYGVTHVIMKPIISSILYDSIVQCFSNNLIENNTEQKELIKSVAVHYVLLVEDNEVNQLIEKDILEQKGYHVTIASDGSEAINVMKEDNNFEVILMDIHMPGVDGYEATRIIRSFNKSVPILAMTAESFSNIKDKSKEVGMNGYLTKPVEPKKLFNEIEKHVRSDNKINTNVKNIDKIEKEMIEEFDYQNYMDIKKGLLQIENKEKLYFEIIEKFYEDTKICGKEVSQLIKNQKLEEAIKLVHKIKGTSGNIGALLLFQSSKTLMTALNEGIEVDIGPYLWEFENNLSKTLEIIKNMLEEIQQNKEMVNFQGSNDINIDIQGLMKDLEYMLNNGDLDAIKVFDKIQEIQPINNDLWEEIENKLKNYKFKEAYNAFKNFNIY